MALVEREKEAFPGLETRRGIARHRDAALKFMEEKGAVCARAEGKIAGALLFSAEDRELSFLAVDGRHRRQHIAKRMTEFMLSLMPAGDITVTTYRENAPAGQAARAFYKFLGFTEGCLKEEFNAPVQEFVLKR